MSVVYFLRGFPSCHPNFVGVNNHEVIPIIHVRGIFRFMLSTQASRYFGRHAPEHFVFRIDEIPLVLDIGRLSRIRFHYSCNKSKRCDIVRFVTHTVNVFGLSRLFQPINEHLGRSGKLT